MKTTRISRGGACVLIAAACLSSLVFAQEEKLNFAVVALKNGEGVTAGEAEIIADRLRTELFRTGRASMMERDQMQEILKEQGFQVSGACTDEACMVEIGQLLGVQRLVSGSIGRLGSMFLVNFRTIDVETAKIVKVVSVDIKGDIEDVVGELAGIAMELVGAQGAPKAAPALKEEKKVAKKEEKKEEVRQEPEETETETVVEDADKREKNANRGGVRLCFTLFPGPETHSIEGVEVDLEPTWENTSRVPLMAFQVKFVIKAGRFFTVDIGPGFSFAREDFSDSDIDGYGSTRGSLFTYIVPAACLGGNFVWRFFPLKLNVGPLVDFQFPVEAWKTYVDDVFFLDGDSTTVDVQAKMAFRVSAGVRAGAEILVGPRVGFAFDFVFRPFRYEVTWEDEYYDTYLGWQTIYVDHEVKFPSIGLGVSANFYF